MTRDFDANYANFNANGMSDLLYKENVFTPFGLCMKVHRGPGKGPTEDVDKDALTIELQRTAMPFGREIRFPVESRGMILPHHNHADLVISRPPHRGL